MDPEDFLNLLPPLPSLDELQSEMPDESGLESMESSVKSKRRSYVRLTDEEFNRALRGEVSISGTTLTVHEIVEQTTKAALDQPQDVKNVQPKAPEVTPLSDAALEAYGEAAALRYTYRLDVLTPVSDSSTTKPRRYDALCREERDQVFTYLTGRSEIVSDARGNTRWMLRDDERRAALLRLLEKNTLTTAIEQARSDAAEELRQASELLKATPKEKTSPKTEDELSASRVEETLWDFLSKPQTSSANERRQLLINQRVVEWVHGLPGLVLPSPQDITYQLAKETLLQPFRHLTGEWKDGKFVSNFTGRGEELSRIYDYLSVLPPPSLSARLTRILRRLSHTTWNLVNRAEGHRPLLIHGPGGVGKSTLLAKFLLDHLTETNPADRFPYAYLDCDVSSLSVLEPLTVLAEAARQLATQYPSSEQAWNEARKSWLAKTGVGNSYRVDPASRMDAIAEFNTLLRNSEANDICVKDQFERGLPFLLVMDTFEEVQYRDRDGIKDVFRLLNIMRSFIPNLHIIMMGRAPLGDVEREFAHIESIAVEADSFGTGEATDFSVIEVELGDLEKTEALDYLQQQGITDHDLAEELVEIVSGNPLSLRLIVKVFKKGDLDLTSLREETNWRPGVSGWFLGRRIPPKALLQGVLFDRILGHIHDKKVKKLAHPGLILRRITWELIQQVLAGPCGLGKIDEAQARSYFQQLADEVSLVGTDRDQFNEAVIRHRPELRRIMLRLMEADEEMKEPIHQVHENAIKFYEHDSLLGREAREEALYHRLMLGKTIRESDYLEDVPTEEAVDAGYAVTPKPDLDPRTIWLRLANAADEFPLAGRAYLAARLGADTLSDEDWEKVDRQDFELMILKRCSHRARVRQNLVSALEGLRRQRDQMVAKSDTLSPLSPLLLMEPILLERLGSHAEVEKVATPAIARLRKAQNSDRRLMQFALVLAEAYARMANNKSCDESITLASTHLKRITASSEDGTRYIRMFLRVATFCYSLTSSPLISDETMRWLRRVLVNDGLKGFGSLARWVVSVISRENNLELFKYVQSESLLPILFTRLPVDTTARVSEVLGRWATQAVTAGADEDQIKKVIKLHTKITDSFKLREALKERLTKSPEEFGTELAKLFKQTSQSPELMSEFCSALAPKPPAGNSGESVFEEARRNGDLMPGEGILDLNPTANRKP
jgi:GTPase SAR1 family protein